MMLVLRAWRTIAGSELQLATNNATTPNAIDLHFIYTLLGS
jgi:hypothetical protein